MESVRASSTTGPAGVGVVPFSDRLEAWLSDDCPRTLGALGEVFAEKGFAVVVVFLLLPTAVPAPTGGFTHAFEAVAALLGAQMLLGARSLWFPGRWRDRSLPDALRIGVLPFVVDRIRWLERYGRPRGAGILERGSSVRLLGLIVVGFAAAAFLGPPFSVLEAFPATGATLVALGVILGDLAYVGVGVVVGGVGAALMLAFGAASLRLSHQVLDDVLLPLRHWWHRITHGRPPRRYGA